MKLTPLNSNILVKPLKATKETDWGLILKVSQEADKAEVVAVGPTVENVNDGEVLMIDWNKTTKIKEDLYMINEADVIGVFE